MSSKWYYIPPYLPQDGHKVVNEDGELVAIFEAREDAELAVRAVNGL